MTGAETEQCMLGAHQEGSAVRPGDPRAGPGGSVPLAFREVQRARLGSNMLHQEEAADDFTSKAISHGSYTDSHSDGRVNQARRQPAGKDH